jgi:opacity protein-like surface antigen
MKRAVAYLLITLTVPALLTLASPAAATYDPYGTGSYWTRMGPYVAFKGGVFIPQSDLDNMGFDSSFYGEIALGAFPHPSFATELTVGWTRPEADFAGGTAKVTVVPVMLNAKIPIPAGPVSPYVIGGVGGYWVEIKDGGLPKDEDWAFGLQAGAGLDFKIMPEVTVGVEGKYHWAEPTLNGTDVKVEGFTVVGTVGFHF